jgi:hypothetical protein
MASRPAFPMRHVMRLWRSVFSMVVIAIVAGLVWSAAAVAQTLARYTIIPLGKGGIGKVYLTNARIMRKKGIEI